MTETSTEIAALPSKDELPALFQQKDGIKQVIDRIEKEVLAEHQDYSTVKGRKAARSLASKVSKSKTALEAVRKDLTKDWREKTAAVNAIGSDAVSRLDELRDKIKAPAEEFERKEAERVQKHMQALDVFDTEQLTAHSTTAELNTLIERIQDVEISDAWEEFEAEAREKKAAALTKYNADLELATAREQQEQELAELRREKVEREEREAAEREAKEREEREAAEKTRLENERKKAEERATREAEERAEREKTEAEERHQRELAEAKEREAQAVEKERLRRAEERRQQEAAEQRRKADAENRRRIRQEIVTAIATMKPANWEEVVDAMIANEIPHVKVQF